MKSSILVLPYCLKNSTIVVGFEVLTGEYEDGRLLLPSSSP
jgi:hypothetical protein